MFPIVTRTIGVQRLGVFRLADGAAIHYRSFTAALTGADCPYPASVRVPTREELLVRYLGLSRRTLLLGLLALLLALVPLNAAATIAWCKTDPVVTIDDQVADIWVSSTIDAFTAATGPTQLVITVPVGISTAYVVSDLGFGHGYDVQFAESPNLTATASGIEVHVAVYVPTGDSTLPVLVEFAPRVVGILAPASAEGTTNAWIDLGTML